MAVLNGNGYISSDTELLDKFLDKYPVVKLIHIQYLDLSAVVRSRLVPLQTFKQIVAGNGVHPGSGSIADLAMPTSNAIIPELLELIIPTTKIKPDISTLRFSYDSGRIGNTATCIASIHPNVEGMALDARSLLTQTVADAEKQYQLKFLVGHELEFCFTEIDGSAPTTERQTGLHNGGILSRSRYWPVLNEILAALAEQNVDVIEIHKEYDPVQFELALPPRPPVESADLLVYARELIRDIAYRHGLNITFYPDPFITDHLLTAAHVHISATQTDPSSTFEPDQFLGGILSHIPALCALGMSSIDSYGRVDPMHIAAGAYVAWGTNNRSTVVRGVTKNHWELRCSDGSSNPYLMTSAIISAGLDKKPLKLKDVNGKSSVSQPSYSRLLVNYNKH